MVGLVFQVNPPRVQRKIFVGRVVVWARAAAGCIFPLGPARERLRVEVALVFRGGWLVPAFE